MCLLPLKKITQEVQLEQIKLWAELGGMWIQSFLSLTKTEWGNGSSFRSPETVGSTGTKNSVTLCRNSAATWSTMRSNYQRSKQGQAIIFNVFLNVLLCNTWNFKSKNKRTKILCEICLCPLNFLFKINKMISSPNTFKSRTDTLQLRLEQEMIQYANLSTINE